MTPVEVGNGQEEGYDTDEDNPLMYTQKAENIGTFFLSCNTHKDSEGIFGRMHLRNGTGLTYTGWHLAIRPHHTEYIHQIEEGQQESSCSGAE